jgi:hypothetical protein
MILLLKFLGVNIPVIIIAPIYLPECRDDSKTTERLIGQFLDDITDEDVVSE